MSQEALPFAPAPNRKRRLILAGVVILALASGATGFFVYRKLAIRQEFAEIKKRIIDAANNKNDLATAEPLISRFLERDSGDAEVLDAYVRLLLSHPSPQGKNRVTAVQTLIRLASVYSSQDNPQAALDARIQAAVLLDQLGAAQPATEVAQLALAQQPSNGVLLRIVARNTLRIGRNAEAERVYRQLVSLEPDDFELQNQTLALLRDIGRTNLEVDQFVADNLKSTGSNTAATLNAIVWQFMSNRPKRGESLLRDLLKSEGIDLPDLKIPAADQPSTQPAALFVPPRTAPPRPLQVSEVRQLVVLLDGVNQRQLAQQLLDKYLPLDPTGKLRHLALLRAWDVGNHPVVRRLIEQVDLPEHRPTDPKTHAAILLAGAVRFAATGETELRQRYVDQLSALPVDLNEVPLTVYDLLTGGTGGADPRSVLSFGEATGQIDVFGGTAFAGILQRDGQNEQAEALLSKLVNTSPVGWSIPNQLLVQLRRSRGNLDGALRAAQAAFQRSGGSIEQGVAFAIQLADVVKRDRSDPRQLIALAEQIQEAVPGEQRTLSILAEFRAVNDPAGARRLLEQSIAKRPDASLDQLLEWARLSSRSKLGLEAQLVATARQRFGDGPQVMYLWAMLEALEGRATQARAKLDQLLADAPEDQKRPWQEVRIRFLSQIDVNQARAELTNLVDAHPDDIALQRNALSDPLIIDRDLIQRAINRVKAAAPNDSTWQVANARLLLDQSPSQSTLSEQSALLTKIIQNNPVGVETRLLLVEYLRRMGNLRGAIQQIDRGLASDPDQLQLLLARIQLMIEDGQTREADNFLNQLAQNPVPLSPVQRAMVAQMNLSIGNNQRAIDTLAAAKGLTFSNDLQLAQLYLDKNDLARAASILDPLLTREDVPPPVLLLGAQLRSAQGRQNESELLIQKLTAAPDPSGEIRLLLAQYRAQQGKLEDATLLISNVLTSDPSNVQAFWLSSQLAAAQGNFELALQRVADAHKADPKNPSIAAAFEQTDRIRKSAAAGFASVATALMRSPGDEAVRDLADFVINSQTLSTRAAQQQLDQLTLRHANSPAVQIFAAERFLAVGQPGRAAATIRSLQSRPGNRQPEAARIAAIAQIRTGEFRDALDQIEIYKEGAGPNNTNAILLAAQANMGLGRYDRVIDLLDPLVKSAQQSDQMSADLAFNFARAAYNAGKPDLATPVLQSFFAKEPSARFAWLKLAASEIDRTNARKWIERIDADTPAASRLPQINLSIAIAQEVFARRFNDAAAVEAAQARIREISLQPDLTREAKHIIAEYKASTGNHQEAAAIYQRLLAEHPNDATALNNGAMALLQNKQASLALPLALKASELLPNTPAIFDTIALVLIADKRPEQAITWAEKAVKLQPLDPHWKLTLAEAMIAAQRREGLTDLVAELRWFLRESSQWPSDYTIRLREIEAALQPARPATRPATTRAAVAGSN